MPIQCILCTLYLDLVTQVPLQCFIYCMDPEIFQLRRNLNTFTLAELKKEVIKMKTDKFAVTKMKRNQVVNPILTYIIYFLIL